MKKIEAIIRPEKFDRIKEALSVLGYPGMTVTKVNGHGNQKGIRETWRGKSFRIDLLSKIKIEITVRDTDVENIVNAIVDKSQTGNIGDGKIFISHIENVYRIRTNESGEVAV